MKALSNTRRQQLQAFDLLATIVLLTRPDGQVVYANAPAEDALGVGRRALEQARLQDLSLIHI